MPGAYSSLSSASNASNTAQLMFKDQRIFESEPFTKHFCSNRAHPPITGQGPTVNLSSPCSQPPCSSSDHHCWCLGCNPISPFRLRYSDDQPSYYGGDSPEGESRDPCLSWDCHILALPLKSWKNHFFSGPLSNLWNDQRTVLLLRRFNRVQLSATP